MHWFLTKLKNFIWDCFWSILAKKLHCSLLSFYVAVTPCKTSEKFHWLLIIAEKLHFGPGFGPRIFKTKYSPKIKVCVNFKSLCGCSFIRFRALFQKAWFASILGLYVAVTSCKNQKKLNELTFDNAWKTSFWATFGLKTSK